MALLAQSLGRFVELGEVEERFAFRMGPARYIFISGFLSISRFRFEDWLEHAMQAAHCGAYLSHIVILAGLK